MSSFPAILGNKKPSEYKNVLVSTNLDVLQFDTPLVFTGDFDVECEINSYVESNKQYLFTSVGLTSFIQLPTRGRVLINFEDATSYVSPDDIAPRTGRFILRINKVGLNAFVYVDGVLAHTFALSGTANFNLDRFSRGDSVTSFDGAIFSMSIDGDVIHLNEGNDIDFTSNSGLIYGRRKTAHADQLDYINSTMVKAIYGSNLDYKDVLVAANQDYLELDNTFTQPDNSIIEIKFNILTTSSFQGVFSDGTLNNYLGTNDGDRVFMYTGGVGGTVLTGQATVGVHTLKIRRGVNQNFLSIDSGVEELHPSPSPLEVKNLFNYNTSYFNAELFNFTLNSEQFKPDGNGLTYTGSNGTVVTRNTSHNDQINYINLTMINKI